MIADNVVRLAAQAEKESFTMDNELLREALIDKARCLYELSSILRFEEAARGRLLVIPTSVSSR